MSNGLDILGQLAQTAKDKRLEVDYSFKGMWKSPAVDFITFCRDWVREPLFDGEQERFATDFVGIPTQEQFWSHAYTIALLFWGKGSGKGSISAKLLTYAGYLLKNMRNPRDYFGLGHTAPLHMINISYNSFNAKTVFFDGYLKPTVLNTINPKTGVNFFKECGMDMRVGEGDIQSNMIHFERPKKEGEGGITAVSLAGDRGTAEGFSPLLVFVDEISAMQSAIKADKLVDDLEKSAQSRFGDYRKLIIASFKQGKNCLMSLKVKEAEDNKIPRCYLSRASTWEVNKNKTKEQLKDLYDKNPVKAARSYECKEVEGVDEDVFYKLQDRLKAAFNYPDRNPFEGDVIRSGSDQLKLLNFKPWFRPHPAVQYNIHIDLAKGTGTDRAGLVMTHREGMESLRPEDLDKYISGEIGDIQFKVKADIILQITPAESGQIIIEDVRHFVYRLNQMGFKLSVTLDGFQSLDFLQQLEARNIPSQLLSVDRNRQAYDSTQSLIYRNGLDLYPHPFLLREMEELEESEDGRKIDHPAYSIKRAQQEGIDKGSKDLADALCGSALRSVIAPSPKIPIAPSLQSGYSQWEEDVEDLDRFNKDMSNGMVPVDSDMNPKKKGQWIPLIPTKG
jgi:hypothetical protein